MSLSLSKYQGKTIYWDYAAATPLDPSVARVMEKILREEYANPSSLHKPGRRAADLLSLARERIARILHCQAREIIFVGSGTESDNLALRGAAHAARAFGNHIITTTIEHEAVLETCSALEHEGFEVTYLNVNHDGLISPQQLRQALRKTTILVSVMYANNEIGTIQPIQEVAQALKRWRKVSGRDAKESVNYLENIKESEDDLQNKEENKRLRRQLPFFHTDACQAGSYLDLNVARLGVDLLSLNAGKIYGPKGVGLLYARTGVALEPMLTGGGQEFGKRSGTQDLVGIVGFAKALELVQKKRLKEGERLTRLRERLTRELLKKIPHTRLNGHPVQRLPNNVNICFEGVEAETLLLYLSEQGIFVSSGSACSSHISSASHVLMALGLNESQARSSLRMTLGRQSTNKEVERVIAAQSSLVGWLRGNGLNEPKK